MLEAAVVSRHYSCPMRYCYSGTARSKRDGTCAETRFGLSAKRTGPLKWRGGGQFSRLLAVEECGSADRPWIDCVPTYSARLLATHSIHIFPLHFPSRASPCAISFRTAYTFECTLTYAEQLYAVCCYRHTDVMFTALTLFVLLICLYSVRHYYRYILGGGGGAYICKRDLCLLRSKYEYSHLLDCKDKDRLVMYNFIHS